MFFIIWPERRFVSHAQMSIWYSDAVANGELDTYDRRHTDMADKARALQSAGIITLGTPDSEVLHR